MKASFAIAIAILMGGPCICMIQAVYWSAVIVAAPIFARRLLAWHDALSSAAWREYRIQKYLDSLRNPRWSRHYYGRP